jgi:hypothetical protein
MGAAGLARVHQRFTVERMVAETATVYERVSTLNAARGPRESRPGT